MGRPEFETQRVYGALGVRAQRRVDPRLEPQWDEPRGGGVREDRVRKEVHGNLQRGLRGRARHVHLREGREVGQEDVRARMHAEVVPRPLESVQRLLDRYICCGFWPPEGGRPFVSYQIKPKPRFLSCLGKIENYDTHNLQKSRLKYGFSFFFGLSLLRNGM